MDVRWYILTILIVFLYYIRASNVPVTVQVPDSTTLQIEMTEGKNNFQAIQVNNNLHEKPVGTHEVRSADVTPINTAHDKMNRSIRIEGDSFMLDGKPLQVRSGSLHYFRVPAEYWRDRLRKLRSAGLNAVATYVEWSFHEPEERQYRFTGDHDVARFVREAAEEGLLVLLRPGPYICAERDLGGFPYWLLGKYPNIRLRTTDADYISETDTWLGKLFEELTPLLYGNGGPIILVQVENEYGSFGSDVMYMEKCKEQLALHVGENALLFTTDGAYPAYFKPGSVNGALATIDFGPGVNASSVFAKLRKFIPEGPLMNSEFYPGWLTHWGERLSLVTNKAVAKALRDLLDINANFNFYVFFGGSNFDFTAGANYFSLYQPDITSYDYDAPINEAGDLTAKYFVIRDILEEYFPETQLLPLPRNSDKGAYGPVSVISRVRLLSPMGRQTLGRKYKTVVGSQLPTFEALRQRAGFLLYETKVTHLNVSGNTTRLLRISKPRDRVYVFVDGESKGVISRMHKIYSLPFELEENSTLSLLVENQGRINYGPRLHDRKGILSPVLIDEIALAGEWTIYGYPLEEININEDLVLTENNTLINGPTLYEGCFTLPEGEEPKDTFFNPTGWRKGIVWVNGHNVGRYWPEEGPQITLYVPGVWLNKAPAKNQLQILELEMAPLQLTVTFIDHPILDGISEIETEKSKI